MKINKEFILKNLTAILSVIAIVSMFLPFIAVEASASAGGFSAGTGAIDYNGFTLITEGGLFGILLELCLLVIIASSYIPQLKQYRKFVLLGASVISLICILIVPGSVATAIAAAGNAGGGFGVKVEVSYSLRIGFWVMLIADIAVIAMSVIQFFGLKGNKVFDMVNSVAESDESGGMSLPQINVDKFKGMAQNVAGNISNAAGNIKNSVTGKVGGNNNSAVQANQNSANNISEDTAAPTANAYQSAPQNVASPSADSQAPSAPAAEKISRDDIMKLIKELHEMKEAGILTDEEFAVKKQEYLKQL